MLMVSLALGSWADEMEDVPVPCKLSYYCFVNIHSLTLKKLVSYQETYSPPLDRRMLRTMAENFKALAPDMVQIVRRENGAGAMLLIQVSLALAIGRPGNLC